MKYIKCFIKNYNNSDGIVNYGYALRNGRFAVKSAIMKYLVIEKIDTTDFKRSAGNVTEEMLSKWLDFEKDIVDKKTNSRYFVDREDPLTGAK